MKICKQFFISLMVLLGFSLNLYSQAKSISTEDFESAQAKANANVGKQIHRITTFDKRYENNSLTVINLYQEFLPPDNSKWVFLETKGNSVKRTELIYIGDFEYRKVDKGDWVKRNLKTGGGGFGGVITAARDTSTKEYFVDEVKIGKERFKVFSSSTITDLGRGKMFHDYKIWINNQGLIYKTTSNLSFNNRENVITTSTAIYDYSPKKPKIEAPILKNTLKP